MSPILAHTVPLRDVIDINPWNAFFSLPILDCETVRSRNVAFNATHDSPSLWQRKTTSGSSGILLHLRTDLDAVATQIALLAMHLDEQFGGTLWRS